MGFFSESPGNNDDANHVQQQYDDTDDDNNSDDYDLLQSSQGTVYSIRIAQICDISTSVE